MRIPLKLSHKVGLLAAAYVWFKNGALTTLPLMFAGFSNTTTAFVQELAADPATKLDQIYMGLYDSPMAASLLLYILLKVFATYFKRKMTVERKHHPEAEPVTAAAATGAPAAATKSSKKRK